MKAALKKIFLFSGILAIFLIAGSFSVKAFLRNGDFYKIKPDTKHIVFGHSQPECGLDDALVRNVENFSQGGESYFYTYQKAKKLLEANSQIKTVIISFANNQIQKRMDKWIWGDENVYNSYPKYNFVMSGEDYGLLLKHNLTAVLKSETKAFKEFVSFVAKNRKNYLSDRRWGGYLYLKRNKIDSLLKTDYMQRERAEITPELSETNIGYLKKLVALCKSKNVNVVFLRMPVHPEMPFLKNEAQYQQIKNTRFADIELLDFKNFPATDDEYGDFDHLNHKGAKRFSVYFNKLVQDGLLQSANKQQIIDASLRTLTLKDTISQ